MTARQHRTMVADVGKLVLLLAGLLIFGAAFILGITLHDNNAQTVGAAGVAGVLGYLKGNGTNARRGDAPSTVFVPSPDRVDGNGQVRP